MFQKEKILILDNGVLYQNTRAYETILQKKGFQ